jgi:hypothetical protein
MTRQVHIAGVGSTAFGVHSEHGLQAVATQAAGAAINPLTEGEAEPCAFASVRVVARLSDKTPVFRTIQERS